MIITFRLGWLKGGGGLRRAFRLPGSADWMQEYVRRVVPFAPCRVEGGEPEAGSLIWALDRSAKSQPLSSEALAGKLKGALDSGVKRLEILVGGPDGYKPGELERLKPALRWSFGPPTFPHELAAVAAAEQIYRAWAILRNIPYHR